MYVYTHTHLHHGECNGGSMVGSGGRCVLGPQYTFVYRQRPVQVPACRQKMSKHTYACRKRPATETFTEIKRSSMSFMDCQCPVRIPEVHSA